MRLFIGFIEAMANRIRRKVGASVLPYDHTHRMVARGKAREYLAGSGANYEAAKLTLTRQAFGLPY